MLVRYDSKEIFPKGLRIVEIGGFISMNLVNMITTIGTNIQRKNILGHK